MKISIIGSGNVAWHLAPLFENAGHQVVQVYSRTESNAKELVERLYDAKVNTSLDFSSCTSDIFLLCISDQSIESVCKELVLPDHSILIHTSGSVSVESLHFCTAAGYGVLYPLQTFTKRKKLLNPDFPVLVEGSEERIIPILNKLGSALSSDIRFASSEQRLIIHLAAVFASNFTNHLLALCESILAESNLDLDLLKPLVSETLNKSFEIGPTAAQTGPARRNDFTTMDNHEAHLQSDELREIYQLISKSISKKYN